MSDFSSWQRSGYAIAVLGVVLALAIGWPLSLLLGHGVLYVAYFALSLFAARYGGAVSGLCVLIAGCIAGPLVGSSLIGFMPVRQTSAEHRYRCTPPPGSRASWQ